MCTGAMFHTRYDMKVLQYIKEKVWSLSLSLDLHRFLLPLILRWGLKWDVLTTSVLLFTGAEAATPSEYEDHHQDDGQDHNDSDHCDYHDDSSDLTIAESVIVVIIVFAGEVVWDALAGASVRVCSDLQ